MKVLVVGGGEFARSIIKVLSKNDFEIHSIDKFGNQFSEFNCQYLSYYDIQGYFEVIFYAISDLEAAKENREFINKKCTSKFRYGVWSSSYNEIMYFAQNLKKRKIFVHIGGPKTASTFVQNVLETNKTVLNKNQLSYMQRNRDYLQFIHAKNEDKKVEILKSMDIFFSKNADKNIITSDEDFHTMLHTEAFEAFVKLLEKSFSEIYFMFTIRPQWELIESLFITDKLNGLSKNKETYVDEYLNNLGYLFDYNLIHRRLRNVSSKQNGINISNFSSDDIINNIIDFVLQTKGFFSRPVINMPTTQYNPTLKPEVIQYINSIAQVGTPYHTYLKHVSWQNKKLHLGDNKNEFSYKLKERIFEFYNAKNKQFLSDVYKIKASLKLTWEKPVPLVNSDSLLSELEISRLMLSTTFEKKVELNKTIW